MHESIKRYLIDHPENPFNWKDNPRPSIFQADPYFRAPKTGRTLSQASTENVEKQRREGKPAGLIRGISRNKEAEILRMKTFSIFSQASKGK